MLADFFIAREPGFWLVNILGSIGVQYLDYQQIIAREQPFRDLFFVLHVPLIIVILCVSWIFGNLSDYASHRVVIKLSNGRVVGPSMSGEGSFALAALIKAVMVKEIEGFDGFSPRGKTISYRAADFLDGSGYFDIGDYVYKPDGIPFAVTNLPWAPINWVIKLPYHLLFYAAWVATLFFVYNAGLWYFSAPSVFHQRIEGVTVFSIITATAILLSSLVFLYTFVLGQIFARTSVELSIFEFDGYHINRRVVNSGAAKPMAWLLSGLRNTIHQKFGFNPFVYTDKMWDNVLDTDASRHFMAKRYQVIRSKSGE